MVSPEGLRALEKFFQHFFAIAIVVVILGSLLVLAIIIICIRCLLRNRKSNLDVMGNPQPLDNP